MRHAELMMLRDAWLYRAMSTAPECEVVRMRRLAQFHLYSLSWPRLAGAIYILSNVPEFDRVLLIFCYGVEHLAAFTCSLSANAPSLCQEQRVILTQSRKCTTE